MNWFAFASLCIGSFIIGIIVLDPLSLTEKVFLCVGLEITVIGGFGIGWSFGKEQAIISTAEEAEKWSEAT